MYRRTKKNGKVKTDRLFVHALYKNMIEDLKKTASDTDKYKDITGNLFQNLV